MLEYKYDKQADAMYITLREDKYAYGKDFDENRRIDYSSSDQPIGIELLSVSRGVNLTDLPFSDELMDIMKDNRLDYYKLINLGYSLSETGTTNVILGVYINEDESIQKEYAIRENQELTHVY